MGSGADRLGKALGFIAASGRASALGGSDAVDDGEADLIELGEGTALG